MNNNLGHLPSEILYLILDNVYRHGTLYECALINKRWHRLANPRLWQEPKKRGNRYYNNGTTEVVLNSVRLARLHQHRVDPTPPGNHIHILYSMKGDQVTTLLSLTAYTPNVKELHLNGLSITDKDMDILFQHCPQLRKLKLTKLEKITNLSIASLGYYCQELKQLAIFQCDTLSPTALTALIHCPLKVLMIYSCNWGTSIETASIVRQFNQLTSLVITRCNRGISSDFIQHLLPADETNPLPLLTKCDLDGSDTTDAPMNDAVMLLFMKSHPRLESFSLNYCHTNDIILDAIATHLVHLRRLSFYRTSGLSCRSVRRLVIACPRLDYVFLNGCNLPSRCFPESSGQPPMMGVLDKKSLEQIRINGFLDYMIQDDTGRYRDGVNNAD